MPSATPLVNGAQTNGSSSGQENANAQPEIIYPSGTIVGNLEIIHRFCRVTEVENQNNRIWVKADDASVFFPSLGLNKVEDARGQPIQERYEQESDQDWEQRQRVGYQIGDPITLKYFRPVGSPNTQYYNAGDELDGHRPIA